MSFYQIDTKRNWQGLLRVSVEDLSMDRDDRRLRILGEKDTLILHTRDVDHSDLEAIQTLTSRPRLIVVTAGSRNKLKSSWSKWVYDYDAELFDRVPYFSSDTSSIPEAERQRFVAPILKGRPGMQHSDGGAFQGIKNLSTEDTLVMLRSLCTSLRYWLNAASEITGSVTGHKSTTHERATKYKILGSAGCNLEPLLLPAKDGYGWADVFADLCESGLRDLLLSYLKPNGDAWKTLNQIIGSEASADITRTSPVNATGENIGGCIRFFYDLAVQKRAEQDAKRYLGAPDQSDKTQQARSTIPVGIMLERAEAELSLLEATLDRVSKRHAFIITVLYAAENKRADLHHQHLRQNILQRLIGSEADANLTIADSSGAEKEKIESLSGLLARANEQESLDGRKLAFEAWSGKANPDQGVKHALLQLLNDWRSERPTRAAGLILKPEVNEYLLRVEVAVKAMDSLIGSDSYWRKHQARPEAERKDAAMEFWKNALFVMQCLGWWYAAPEKLFEFYDET